MTIYTETTVEELLTFIEEIAYHTPDAEACECSICAVHNHICGFTMLRSKK